LDDFRAELVRVLELEKELTSSVFNEKLIFQGSSGGRKMAQKSCRKIGSNSLEMALNGLKRAKNLLIGTDCKFRD
jgi:hypothetical protein